VACRISRVQRDPVYDSSTLSGCTKPGVLSDDEHARAVDIGEIAFGDPALDEPVSGNMPAADARVLH
jgi:hypothetical protein